MTALPFLHYPGTQQDELTFAVPLYRASGALYGISIAGYSVPVMVMTYAGALKTWLYAPISKFVRPSYLSIRMPALVFGSLAVWLLFHWLEIAHSRRAAWIAALLVATDTMFLLTTCFDWGPVVLQHLLTLLGLVLVLHFHHRRSILALAAGFFCFGLAFWEKALFVWIAAGLIVAVLVLFPREFWSHLNWKTIAVAISSLLIGASPLIAYNVLERFPTFHATSGFAIQELYPKTFVARDTWEGAALFGYLVNKDTAEDPRRPRNALEAASFTLHSRLGEHRHNALNWAGLAAGLLFVPALWWKESRRIVLFCVIVIAIAWVQMGLTKGAGGAAHHVVLLWPFPHAALAVIFAETSRRLGGIGLWLIGTGIALLLGANLLETNQYLYQFARDGAAGSWSDAIYPLLDDLSQMHPRKIAVIDWGIDVPLQVLGEGRLPVVWIDEASNPAILNDPEVVWVSHTNGSEQFTGVNDRFDALARAKGFEETAVRTYADSNGRPILQSFRLQSVRLSASCPRGAGYSGKLLRIVRLVDVSRNFFGRNNVG